VTLAAAPALADSPHYLVLHTLSRVCAPLQSAEGQCPSCAAAMQPFARNQIRRSRQPRSRAVASERGTRRQTQPLDPKLSRDVAELNAKVEILRRPFFWGHREIPILETLPTHTTSTTSSATISQAVQQGNCTRSAEHYGRRSQPVRFGRTRRAGDRML